MIFDKDYDTALWYIVRADKKQGKEILEFLRGIPEEAITKIRDEIKFQKENDPLETPEIHRFMSKDEPNMYYDISVEPVDMSLTITKGIEDGKFGKDIFELILLPVNLELLEQMEYSIEEWIGGVNKYSDWKCTEDNGCKSQTEVFESETEYNIYRLPIGYFISNRKEELNRKREFVHYRPINIKKVPKDITTENIIKRRLVQKN